MSEQPATDPDRHRQAVVITGCSSGIGAETARWLNQRGFLVFAGLRRPDQFDAVMNAVDAPDRMEPIQLDVTCQEQIENASRHIASRLQQHNEQLVGLVNNAADENLGPVEVLPLDVFRQEMEVGYFGAVAVTKQFLPLLRSSAGRIVNLSSVNGRCTFKFHATTCATKYAMEAFSDALRMELKPWGMHVSLVEPGPTRTPLMKEKTILEFTEKLASYPPDELERYFPDYEATVQKVEQFVTQIDQPPRGFVDKIKRLISGQGWLHEPNEVARLIEHANSRERAG